MPDTSRETKMTRERAFGRIERIRDYAGETGDMRTVEALDVLLALVPASEPSPALAPPRETCINCPHVFQPPDEHCYFGVSSAQVGPFCVTCYERVKRNTATPIAGTGAQTETPEQIGERLGRALAPIFTAPPQAQRGSVHPSPAPASETPEPGNEQRAFERLSLALTKGNAGTWDELFHAAESAEAERDALRAQVGEHIKARSAAEAHVAELSIEERNLRAQVQQLEAQLGKDLEAFVLECAHVYGAVHLSTPEILGIIERSSRLESKLVALTAQQETKNDHEQFS
jgi:hypothetical protein